MTTDAAADEARRADDDDDFLFRARRRRLQYLELWRELGVRPYPEDRCCAEDLDLLRNDGDDDLAELSARCAEARRSMNDAFPPHELARDDDLIPMPSGIAGAGRGLFFRPRRPESDAHPSRPIIRMGEVACYYCGHLHDFRSRGTLGDESYLMLVHGDLFVDPAPLEHIKARYINDPLNDRYVNCEFVPQPERLRCAVVATRDIAVGEELFVSYGEAYWSQRKDEGTIYTSRKQ